MRLTELEKSFQFGMSIGFALRRRLRVDRCKLLILRSATPPESSMFEADPTRAEQIE
jgi:hypothetical protein